MNSLPFTFTLVAISNCETAGALRWESENGNQRFRDQLSEHQRTTSHANDTTDTASQSQTDKDTPTSIQFIITPFQIMRRETSAKIKLQQKIKFEQNWTEIICTARQYEN